jgi:hypothetical protein
MKTISTPKAKQSVLRVSPRRRSSLTKTADEIEKWIVGLGGRPVDVATRARLMKSGNWGMPRE